MSIARLLVISAAATVLAITAACGGDSSTTPTATPPPASRTAAPTSAAAGSPTPSVVSTTPKPDTPPAASPTAPASRTPPAGMIFEPAPIDGAEILTMESNPPQYAVHITSGLPSGCHVFDHTDVERTAAQITIYVINRRPDDPMLACTAIYGEHESTVQLGSDFVGGTTYRVQVNERMLEFTAQ